MLTFVGHAVVLLALNKLLLFRSILENWYRRSDGLFLLWKTVVPLQQCRYKRKYQSIMCLHTAVCLGTGIYPSATSEVILKCTFHGNGIKITSVVVGGAESLEKFLHNVFVH